MREVQQACLVADASVRGPVRQISLDDHHMLNVDYAADWSIVGIELLSPRNDELESLVRFARENDLSLEGLVVA